MKKVEKMKKWYQYKSNLMIFYLTKRKLYPSRRVLRVIRAKKVQKSKDQKVIIVRRNQ
jgi:hypothetical protein